jgi:amino acid adenylation domain-containing protein
MEEKPNLLRGSFPSYRNRSKSLPLTSGKEQQVRKDANEMAVVYGDVCLHQLFEQQAARYPEAIALAQGNFQLSYGELNQKANYLARSLLERGIGPEIRVGIYLNRSPEMIIALLAVLKAGGAYVPLDVALPGSRLLYQIQDSQIALLLTRKQMAEALGDAYDQFLCLDHLWDQQEEATEQNPASLVFPDNLIYVIYTSGSTGQPKGVMCTHSGLWNHFRWLLQTFPLTPDDRVLQRTSVSFDAAGLEIFWPLLSGACLVLAHPDAQRDSAALARTMIEQQITQAQYVPSLLRALLDEPALDEYTDLRQLFCGGEALPFALQELFFSRLDALLCNLYGPTESAIDATFWVCNATSADESSAQVVPIGSPLTNIQALVLDPSMTPVLAEEKGELYIGGLALARGYSGQPALTAERFVPDPFYSTQEKGRRLYKTGDQVRLRPDGGLEYIGRLDSQIKIRGFRVELGEIEHVLTEYPAIREAVVIVHENHSGAKQLIAYVVPAQVQQMEQDWLDSIKAFLRQRLPDYMIPAHLMQLEALPLLVNGKVDRQALPRPEQQLRPEETLVRPRTALERSLAQIWTRILHASQISIDDDFFALGGDSISALSLVGLARKAGFAFSVNQLFQYPTIARLAACVTSSPQPTLYPQVSRLKPGGEEDISNDSPLLHLSPTALDWIVAQDTDAPSDLAVLKEELEDAYPLSGMQAGLLFHSQETSGSGVYISHIGLHLEGRLSFRAFIQSWDQLVRTTPVLRTSFIEGDIQAQVVWRKASLPLMVIDATQLTSDAQATLLNTYRQRDGQRGFALHRPPLFRVTLFLLSSHAQASQRNEEKQIVLDKSGTSFSEEGCFYLLWSFHHAILDGWSASNLLYELFLSYEALLQGQEPAALSKRPYRDYIEWLQRQDQPSAEQFWRRHLQGLPAPARLPLKRRTVGSDGNVARSHQQLESVLSYEFTQQLHTVARHLRITTCVLLQASWAYVLSRYCGCTEVLLGLVVAGRDAALEESESLVGLCINALPMRIALTGKVKLADWLRTIHEQQAQVQEYGYYPTWQIQRISGLEPGESLFQNIFVYENYPSAQVLEQAQKCGLQAWMAPTEYRANYPLVAMVLPDEQLHLLLAWQEALLESDLVERMLRYWQIVLESIVARPEQCVADLPLLLREDEEFLGRWNATARARDRDDCLPRMFEQLVEQTPDAIAVVQGAGQLSYAELNRRANRLAHHLQAQGVGPEIRVGVCTGRSLEAIITFLAVFKAGGVYVAIDRTLPANRLLYQIQDAEIALFLTQGQQIEAVWAAPVVCLCLDHFWEQMESEDAVDNPTHRIQPDNLAYITYTSGSTGQPKGVMNEHRGPGNYFRWMLDTYPLGHEDSLLQVASMSFDAIIWEIWYALLSGSKLVLPPSRAFQDSTSIVECILDQQITCALFVPSLLRVLLDEPAIQQCTSLRRVFCTGELLSPVLQERFFSRLHATLHNFYGPTEAAFNVTCWDCLPEARSASRSSQAVPLGFPLDNIQLFLLDGRFLPVPVGAIGELYIGSRAGGIAPGRGYVNRPDATAGSFVPNPFSLSAGDRLFKTGDLARFRFDGNLEFIARADYQVKVRGVRIELDEIEQVLLEHPTVREAVAVVFKHTETTTTMSEEADESGRRMESLAAYVVHTSAGEATPGWPEELRVYLQQRLPEYMIPTFITVLEALPLTHSGKVNRNALPRPTALLEYGFHRSEGRTPQRPVEQLLAGIWQELLHVPVLSVDADFFALGGHSLIAMQVMARMRQQLKVELPIRTLFETPLLADLARRVEQALQGEVLLHEPPLRPVPRTQPIPLSFAQQRLWFLDQLDSQRPTYNAPLVLRLQGPLDFNALKASLARMEARHEILRLRVEDYEGQEVQGSLPAGSVSLRIIDLTGLPLQAREAEGQLVTQQEVHAPFDLREGPLWRVALLHLAEQEWLLLLTMHHIVTDGWSAAIILQELGDGYTAWIGEDQPPTSVLPVQYADYTIWQRACLQGERLQAQLAYWREQLTGLEPLVLPTDYVRPARPGYHGSQESLRLSPQLFARLQTLSRQEGVTLFMTLLTGWLIVLQRYSGQSDLAVGTPVASRTHAELERLIGFFVNTLVLRCTMQDDMCVRDMLRQVREMTLQAYSHQELPFEQLVEALQPERDLSYHPLFQVMFDLVRGLPATLDWGNLVVKREEILLEVAKFDLSLTITEEEQGLLMSLEYNTSLFRPDTISRVLNHLQRVLNAMVDRPEQRITELPFLSREECTLQLEEWNATPYPYVWNVPLHQLFAEQVGLSPDAVALAWGEIQLTYAVLNERANQMAHCLQRRGIGPEIRAGLCIERCPELIIAVLAILKAGGCYVPLDMELPAQRLLSLLQDAQVTLVLTQQSMRELFAPSAIPLFFVDRAWPELAREELSTDPLNRVLPDNLFCLIYTSGSTGQPKGVMLTQRGLTNHFHWHDHTFPLACDDNVLQLASVSFDTSLNDIFQSLLRGARLTLLKSGGQRDGAYLLRVMTEQNITCISPTPQLLQVLLEENILQKCKNMRKVICGGEALLATLQKLFFSCMPIDLYNTYGPTETSIEITCWRCVPDEHCQIAPLGRPINNTRIYLLDRHMQPVPIGAAGELYVGGDALGRGYFQRSDQTAERFVPDPFSQTGGERLYRTGDLARYRADGTIEFLGRTDDQVKVRGFRVEPAEIIQALREYPLISEAIVVAREDQHGSQYLVAYVVLHRSQALTTGWREAVLAYLRQRLPEYMLPALIVPLEALPLTRSGKVDRQALPDPVEHVASLSGQQVSMRPLEQLLASIWQDVLHIPTVSADQNFFTLGGHSLVVMRVIARIRQRLGIELPVRALFETPTLRDLARLVEAVLSGQAGSARPPLRPVGREHLLPLSYAQERLWFLDQLQTTQPLYNVPLVLHLQGELNPCWLAASLRALEERQENMRLYVEERDGQAYQRWLPVGSLVLRLVDLRGLEPEQREREQKRLLREEAHQPFDLRQGPLWRVCLLRVEEQEWFCVLTLHHIIIDEWSDAILLQNLAESYRAFAQGQAGSDLQPLPVQYADYAQWQREWLQEEQIAQELAYWRAHLANLSPLALPTDYPHPPQIGTRGASASLRISAGLTEQLKHLSQQEGVTLFMTLLAGWVLVLQRYSGQTDIAVGTPIAHRDQAELENVIGFFLNTLVLRCQVEERSSVRDLLRHVREVALQAYSHQDVPFERVVEAIAQERDLSRHPLFQVMFILQTRAQTPVIWHDMLVEQEEIPLETAKFALTLAVQEDAEGLRASLEFNTDLFASGTIQHMLRHWQRALQAMTEQPEQCISMLPLLSKEEQEQQLVCWNKAEHLSSLKWCVHQFFEQQVEQTPEAIALVQGEHELSYEELNQRANRLAHYLCTLGIGPEISVGICLERSLEMIISVLGILKAGGAFVLFDPAYPQERLAAMFADALPAVVLTQKAFVSQLPEQYTSLVVFLDQLEISLSKQPSSNPSNKNDLQNLFCVIYTSGSTGQPKGIAQCHKTLSNLLAWQITCFAQPVSARTLQYASPSFDVCYQEMFSTWATGGTLLLVGDDLRRNPEALLHFMDMLCVERLFVPVVALQQLAECSLSLQRDLPSVREIITAGEQLHLNQDVRQFFELQKRHAGCLLHNQYGPAECHVVTEHLVANIQREHADLPPIGRPIANTQVYLLDREMQLVPAGVTGELYIGGVSLARGYLNKPAMTAERFVPDPFASSDEKRLYRTGDLARYLPDGSIEFLGRVDEQVKVRGYRVEVGEIEAALEQHSAVQACAIKAWEDEAAGRYLAAYIVPRASQDVSFEHIREYLRTKLPEYMIPSWFVQIEALPLTPNRKVDRRALPAPERTRVNEARSDYYGPVEEILAGIWSEVLGVKQVAPDANFFALGGHSLVVMRVIARIRQRLGIELPVRALFETPTLRDLARLVEEALSGQAGSARPPLRPVGREHLLPLSYAQERLWFLDQLQTAQPLYNVPLVLHLQGALNPCWLAASLRALEERQENMRLYVEEHDGQAYQRWLPVGSLVLRLVDLRGLEPEQREREQKRLLREEAHQPFDLRQGPLWRVCLLRVGEQEWFCVLTLHHIIIDEWSVPILLQEIGASYRALANEQEHTYLEPLPVQYADYAQWQREWLQEEQLAQELAYWRAHLANLSPLALPTDYPRPPQIGTRGASASLRISAELTEQLKQLSQQEGVTLFMTLLAGWALVLQRYSGQTDIAVGTPIAHRDQAELENVIGFFLNTLVLRCQIEERGSVRDLLKHVREVALQAYSHQDVPFERVVEAIAQERDLSRHPLFQVMFVLLAREQEIETWDTLRIQQEESAADIARFELTLAVREDARGLLAELEYNTDLFKTVTIQQIAKHWHAALKEMVAYPECPLQFLSLLDEEEQQRQVFLWNATERVYPQQWCVHQFFERRAEQTPDAIAVVAGEQQLSYCELNQRANRLAHALQARGIGPECLVGICIERGLEMVLAILAVLKAGGAYVPMDGELLQQRLLYLAKDAQLSLLLTQEHRAEMLGAADIPLLCLEHVWQQEELANGNLSSQVCPDNLMYVIYTSGSTGLPKGVMNTHRGLWNQFCWMLDAYNLCAEDRILQVASMSFDASVWEIFCPLLCGGRLVLLLPGALQDSVALLQTMVEQQITSILWVPSLLQTLLEEPAMKECTSLRRIFCGGEALPSSLQDTCLNCLSATLYNLYGPTEASIVATAWECQRQTDPTHFSRKIVPLGFPIANVQVYLLDRSLTPVPVGVTGEMYLGGMGLARGYLSRSNLTAERFLPNPFCRAGGERMYRTGDLARYLPDGTIEFVERSDYQVKVRGFRIELGEIEQVLLAHPAVREAVVIARQDQSGTRRLIACIVPVRSPEQAFEGTELLRAYLRQHLPSYMVPSSIITLEALPLTHSGKVDRQKLQESSFIEEEDLTEELQAPQNEVEERLVYIWQDLLDKKKISITDTFFQQGGHSLSALRLLARIHKEFARRIPVAQFFQNPTIHGLAQLLVAHTDERSGRQAFPSALVPLQPHGTHAPFYCVHPGAGNVFCYLSLARQLGADYPVYGLQFPEANERPVQVTVPQLAKNYIAAIRALQPKGPYYLGGWSSGGLVAFEMACQLRSQGQEVALLCMLDTRVPTYFKNERGMRPYTLEEYMEERGVKQAKIRCMTEEEKLQYMYEMHQRDGLLPDGLDLPYVRSFLGNLMEILIAVANYEVPQFDGHLTLLRITPEAEQAEDPTLKEGSGEGLTYGWQAKTSNPIDVQVLPGSHEQFIYEPYVEHVAAALRTLFARIGQSKQLNKSNEA